MKLLWTFIALAFTGCLLTGCAGTQDRQQTCDTARAVYEAYQSTLALREPSKDEILAATAAGAFLRIQCGWTSPKTRGKTPTVDANGVLILTAP